MGLRLYGCMESFYWGYPGSIGAFFLSMKWLDSSYFWGLYYLGPQLFLFFFLFFLLGGDKKMLGTGGREDYRWWGEGQVVVEVVQKNTFLSLLLSRWVSPHQGLL